MSRICSLFGSNIEDDILCAIDLIKAMTTVDNPWPIYVNRAGHFYHWTICSERRWNPNLYGTPLTSCPRAGTIRLHEVYTHEDVSTQSESYRKQQFCLFHPCTQTNIIAAHVNARVCVCIASDSYTHIAHALTSYHSSQQSTEHIVCLHLFPHRQRNSVCVQHLCRLQSLLYQYSPSSYWPCCDLNECDSVYVNVVLCCVIIVCIYISEADIYIAHHQQKT